MTAFLNAQQDKFVELLRVERDEATQQAGEKHVLSSFMKTDGLPKTFWGYYSTCKEHSTQKR
jgi:hypothetical protein